MGAAFQLYIININIDIKYNLYNIISWLTLDAWSLKMWGAAWTDVLQLMDLALLLDCWEDVPAFFFMFEIGSQLKHVETTSFRF